MSSNKLPNGWATANPGQLASDTRNSLGIGPFGSNLKVSDYSNHGVPLIFVRNIRSETFDDANKFVSRSKAQELEAHEVRPLDVLITKMGDPPGDSAIYPVSRPPGIITADCIRWRINPRVGLPAFFAYATRTANIREQILNRTKGVAQKKVSLGRFRSVTYPVAPLAEQRRIIDAIETQLTRLDAAVASLERARANLKRARASVLKAAVEGRLVPTEAELARREGRSYEHASVLLERILEERRRRHEEAPVGAKRKEKYKPPVEPDAESLPKLPTGWVWSTVDQLASYKPRSIQSGPFGSSLRHSEFQDSGKLVIGIDNVQDGYFTIGSENRISESKFEDLERFRARPLDVAITVMATVGRCCVLPADLEPAIITKHVYRITANPQAVHPRYLMYMLKGAPPVRKQMFSKARGQTRLGLNGTIVKSLSIPLPPPAEQERIVESVDRELSVIDAIYQTVEHNLQRCERLRQSVLKRAFEGKLVPQDPNDEPASELLARIEAERASE